jgi:DNA-directed RNA polymerase specialized sigma24 family protein
VSLSSEESIKVFEVARSLLPAAKSWAKRIANIDPDTAEDILMDTVANLIESKREDLSDIHNLPAYLFKAYEHQTHQYFNKNINRTVSLDDAQFALQMASSTAIIDSAILIEEIVGLMDKRSRFIFDLLMCGYSYEEIAKRYEKEFDIPIQANHLRSMFSKSLSKISKSLPHRQPHPEE